MGRSFWGSALRVVIIHAIDAGLPFHPFGRTPPFLGHTFNVSNIRNSLELLERLLREGPVIENVGPKNLRICRANRGKQFQCHESLNTQVKYNDLYLIAKPAQIDLERNRTPTPVGMMVQPHPVDRCG